MYENMGAFTPTMALRERRTKLRHALLAVALLALMVVGAAWAIGQMGWDTATFNRRSAEGTPQRVLIEGLVALREQDTSAARWEGLCHPSDCGDFDAFRASALTPHMEYASTCLLEREHIQFKPAAGAPIAGEGRARRFWIRCDGGDFWMEATMRPTPRQGGGRGLPSAHDPMGDHPGSSRWKLAALERRVSAGP